MYTYGTNEHMATIHCADCDPNRSPIGLFPIEYLTLVQKIVEQLNIVDPENKLIHEPVFHGGEHYAPLVK